MKNIFRYFVSFMILLTIGSCKKERVCSNVPEGIYEAKFTDDGASSTTTILHILRVDNNTLIINTTGESSLGPFVKRSGCNIGGLIEGKSSLGEIQRKKGNYRIQGSYSYLSYDGGLGNPDSQYTKVNGTFDMVQIE